jgi:hypothetical protein
LRNEAIGEGNGLIPQGWRVRQRSGIRLYVDGLLRLEALEFAQGVAVILLGVIDAPLKTGEVIGMDLKRLADTTAVHGEAPGLDAALPELGLADAETAEEPFGVDEGVYQHALFGGGGVEAVVIFELKGSETAGGFAADDLRCGIDTGFQGIHGGAGLALGGARSRGFARVEAIGLDLFLGCHVRELSLTSSGELPGRRVSR